MAFRGRLVRRERHGGTQVNGDEDEMASARYPLRKVQFGMEPAAGSLVAATTQLVADCQYTPDMQATQPAFMRPIRAAQADGGVVTRRGSMLSVQTDLDYEQVMVFLDTGLATRTTSGAGPYTHDYAPDTGALPTVRAATWEFVVDDGSTKEYERRFGYGTTSRLSIDFAKDQQARLTAQVFGRAEQSMTMTAGRSQIGRAHV